MAVREQKIQQNQEIAQQILKEREDRKTFDKIGKVMIKYDL